MSFVQIWAHAVWGIKSHEPLLQKPVRDKVCQHIIENAKVKKFSLTVLMVIQNIFIV